MTTTDAAPVAEPTIEHDGYAVRFQAPARGHFYATISLPMSAPQYLVGDRGIRATRMRALGDHNYIYAIEGFADVLNPKLIHEGGETMMVEMDLRPAGEEFTPNPWVLHDAVRDDFAELVPEITIGGESVTGIAIKPVDESITHKRLSIEVMTKSYGMVMYPDLMARSPIVEMPGLVRRLDGKAAGIVRIGMTFGEPVIGRDLIGVEQQEDMRAIGFVVSLDTAEYAPFRLALLCQSAGISEVQALQEDPEALDIYTLEALGAAKSGPFFGILQEWEGDWLLSPIAKGQFASAETTKLIAAYKQGDARNRKRPHASPDHPHAAGNNNAYGVTYSCFWSHAFPEVVQALLWNAEDYMRRPVHYCEPGTAATPVDPAKHPKLWTKARAPYEGRGPAAFHHVQLGLDRLPGKSELYGRKGHDDQHFADMPLLAAYALTGDPLLEHVMRSHLGMDLCQIQTKLGTSGNGRAEGRVGINMLVAGVLLGGDDFERVVNHLGDRYVNAGRRQTELGGPLGLANNRSNCDLPARTPYEDAQAAYAFWQFGRLKALAYSHRGKLENKAALRSAEVVVDSLYEEDGEWFVPYRVSHDAGEAELSSDSPKVHPGRWFGWSAQALKVFLELAEANDPRRAKVEAALTWWKDQPIRRLSDLHLGGVVQG